MWKVSYEGEADPTDYQVKADDAHSGETAFHFWSGDSDMEFSIEQEVTGLENGTYQLSVFSQGGDMSSDASMELYQMGDCHIGTGITADNNGKLQDTFLACDEIHHSFCQTFIQITRNQYK